MGLALFLWTLFLIGLGRSVSANPPNIVFILADDLGWNDVSWHNPEMLTPNLEKYARDGVILNSSYVQYLCTPSRTAFMTGYYPYHTGLQHIVIYFNQPNYLPSQFKILPQWLKQAGYKTHIVGKWHLGMCNWKYTPTFRGFDSFFGFYHGMEDYYTHSIANGYDLRSNESVALDPNQTYSEYLFTERATHIINNHDRNTPLFLYLPLQLVHTPLQVPAKFTDMYKNVNSTSRRTYSGMVSMMDEAFGNITDALEKTGLMNNTLLVFTTDNGGPVRTAANNWPLRGAKFTLWEGGTRGAAFIYSPTLLQKTGYVNNEIIHAVDWLPTFMHLAGLEADKDIDGVNQWDMLSKGEPSKRDEFVYHIDNIDGNAAYRYKDYKLITGIPGAYNDWYPVPRSEEDVRNFTEEEVRYITEHKGENWQPQLYNIRNDPLEQTDLSASEPKMVKFMLKRLRKWKRSEVPAKYPPNDSAGDPSNWNGVWTPGWC